MRKPRRINLVTLAAVATGLAGVAFYASVAGSAPVGPYNPVAGNSGFTVFIEGDATFVSNENEGTAAVGGSLTIGGDYQVAAKDAALTIGGDAHPTGLLVGGRIIFPTGSGARIQVQNNTYMKVGDLSNAFVRDLDNNGAMVATRVLPANNYDANPHLEVVVRQPVASVGAATGIQFGPAFDAYRQRAAELGACSNTVTLRNANDTGPPDGNGQAYLAMAPGAQTNVLNLTATQLSAINTLTFRTRLPSATSPLLINVDTSASGVYSWAVPNFSGIGDGEAPYILINFGTTTSLTLPSNAATLEGTIFAPDADLVDLSSSNVEGNIIARTFTHGTVNANGGEVHPFPFNATLSCDAPTLPPTTPPTSGPTTPPTEPPTSAPTTPPTSAPTTPPTVPPTEPPTSAPTTPPTEPPTSAPTTPPTQPPTSAPTTPPTWSPTTPPTEPPTSGPTQPPTSPPPVPPTEPPTSGPTESPTSGPTESPSTGPTEPPTSGPTWPTTQPTGPTEPPLPSTGSPGVPTIAFVGGGLVALGAALWFFARRRRAEES